MVINISLQTNGITVTDTYTVDDYIPIFENKLDDIVSATYHRTRGESAITL